MSHAIYLGLLLAYSIHHIEGFYIRSTLSGATDHVEEDAARYNQFAYSLRGLGTTAESSLYYNKRDLEYDDDSVTPQASTNDIVKALDGPFGTSRRSSRNVRGDENPTTSKKDEPTSTTRKARKGKMKAGNGKKKKRTGTGKTKAKIKTDGDFSNGDKGQLGIPKEKSDTVATHLDKLPVRPPIQQTLEISPLPKQQPTTTFSKPDIFSNQQAPPSPQILNNSQLTTASELNKETDNSARPIKNGLDQRILTPNMKLLDDNNGFHKNTGKPDKIIASTTPYKDEGGSGKLPNVNECCKKPTIAQLSSKTTETMANKPQYEIETNGHRHHTIKNHIEDVSKDPVEINDYIKNDKDNLPEHLNKVNSNNMVSDEVQRSEESVTSATPNLEKIPDSNIDGPNEETFRENVSDVQPSTFEGMIHKENVESVNSPTNENKRGKEDLLGKTSKTNDNTEERSISKDEPTPVNTAKDFIQNSVVPAVMHRIYSVINPQQTNNEQNTNTNKDLSVASDMPSLEKLPELHSYEPNQDPIGENTSGVKIKSPNKKKQERKKQPAKLNKPNDNIQEKKISKEGPTYKVTEEENIHDREHPAVDPKILSDIKPHQTNGGQDIKTKTVERVASAAPKLEKLPDSHIDKPTIQDNSHPIVDPTILSNTKPDLTNGKTETKTKRVKSSTPNLDKLPDSHIDEENKEAKSKDNSSKKSSPIQTTDQQEHKEGISANENKVGKEELSSKPNNLNDNIKETKLSDDKPTNKIIAKGIIKDSENLAVDPNILNDMKQHQTNNGNDITTTTVEKVSSAAPKLEILPVSHNDKPFKETFSEHYSGKNPPLKEKIVQNELDDSGNISANKKKEGKEEPSGNPIKLNDNIMETKISKDEPTHQIRAKEIFKDSDNPTIDRNILSDKKPHPLNYDKETNANTDESIASSIPSLEKLSDSHIDKSNKNNPSPKGNIDQKEPYESGNTSANENKVGKEELSIKPKNLNDDIKETNISDDKPTNKIIAKGIIKDSENLAVNPNILNDMKQHQTNNGNDITTTTVEKVSSAAPKLEILPVSHNDKLFKETFSEHYSGKNPPLKEKIVQKELDDSGNISANKNKEGKEEPSGNPIKLNDNIKETKISKEEPTHQIRAKEIFKDSDNPTIDPKILSDKKPHTLNYVKETNAKTDESIASSIPSLEKLSDSHIDKPNKNNPSPKGNIDQKEPYESGNTSANKNKVGKEELSIKPKNLNDDIKETKISDDKPTNKIIAKEIIKDSENPTVDPNILNDMKQHQTNNGNDITTTTVEEVSSAEPKLEILPVSHNDKPFKETFSEHYSGKNPPLKEKIVQKELDDSGNISANKNKEGKEEPSGNPIKLNDNIKETKISKEEPTLQIRAKEIFKDSDNPTIDPKILSDKKPHTLNYDKETNAKTDESIASSIPSLEKLSDSHIDKPNKNNPSPKGNIDQKEPYESGNTSANKNKVGKEELSIKPKNLNDDIKETKISDDKPTNKIIAKEIIKDSENPTVDPNILNDMKQHQTNNGNDITTTTVEEVSSVAPKSEILPVSHNDKPFKETFNEHYSGKNPPLKEKIDQKELNDSGNISANKNKEGKEEPSGKPIKLNGNIGETKASQDEPTHEIRAKEFFKDSDNPDVDPKILSDKKPLPLNYDKETHANTDEIIASAIPSLEKLSDSHIDKPNKNTISGHILGESQSPKESIDQKEPYEIGNTSANENKVGKGELPSKPYNLNDNIKETLISDDKPTDTIIAKGIIKDSENPPVDPNIVNDMKKHQTNIGNDITTKVVEKGLSAAPKLEILPASHIDKPFKETFSESYTGKNPPLKEKIVQKELDDSGNISANKNKGGKEQLLGNPIKMNDNIKETKITKGEPTHEVRAKEIFKDSDNPAVDPKILSDKKPLPLNFDMETNANTEESIASALPSLEKLPGSHIDKPNKNTFSGNYLGESPYPKENIDQKEPYTSGSTSLNENKVGKEERPSKHYNLNDNIMKTQISDDKPTNKIIAKEIIKDSENPTVDPNILNDVKQHQTNNGMDITTNMVERVASAAPKLDKLPDLHINEPNEEAFSKNSSKQNSSPSEKIHPKELIESGDNLANENKSGTEDLPGKLNEQNENIKETKISGDEPTLKVTSKEIFQGNGNPAVVPKILTDMKPNPTIIDEKETNVKTKESIASATPSLDKLHSLNIDIQNQDIKGKTTVAATSFSPLKRNQKEGSKEEKPGNPNEPNRKNEGEQEIEEKPIHEVKSKEIIHLKEKVLPEQKIISDKKTEKKNLNIKCEINDKENMVLPSSNLATATEPPRNKPNQETNSQHTLDGQTSSQERSRKEEPVESGTCTGNKNKCSEEELRVKPIKDHDNFGESNASEDDPTYKVKANDILNDKEHPAIVDRIMNDKKTHQQSKTKTKDSVALPTHNLKKLPVSHINGPNPHQESVKSTVENENEDSTASLKPYSQNTLQSQIDDLKQTPNGDSSSGQENYKDVHHEKHIRNKAQPDSEIKDSEKTITNDPRITHNKNHEKTKQSEDDGTTNVGSGEEMIEHDAEKEKVEDDNLSEFNTGGQYDGEHLPEESEEGQSENKSSLEYEGQYDSDDATHNETHDKTKPSEDDGTTNVGSGEDMIEYHAEKEKVEDDNSPEFDTGGQHEDFGEHLPEQSEESQSENKSSLEYEGQYDGDDETHNKKHEQTKLSEDDGTTNIGSGEEMMEHHAEKEKVEDDNLSEFDTGDQYEDFDEHLPEQSEEGQSDNKSSSEYEGQYDSDDGDSMDTYDAQFDEDGSDDFDEQSKEGLHEHQENEENYVDNNDSEQDHNPLTNGNKKRQEGQHGEVEDEEQEEAEEDESEYEIDGNEDNGDENKDDERYKYEEFHGNLAYINADSKSADEPLSTESEETRHLSQSQLKRFFMLERIKFLRLEQTLVEAKIKQELKALENKN